MKKLLAITLFDSKAETYGPPFFVSTLAAALRDFSYLINDSKSLQGQYPEDFDIYQVGEFDVSSGALISVDKKHIANGVDVKR